MGVNREIYVCMRKVNDVDNDIIYICTNNDTNGSKRVCYK